MRKISKLITTILVLSFVLTGCQKHEKKITIDPEISQIRSICELATLECYYHNVAKSKKKGKWLEKDRDFWVESTGTAKIGIDMAKVNMKIDGNDVTVTLPNAELLGIDIDEENLNKTSYYSDEDRWWNKNKITANDQTKAINNAQENMRKTVENDKALLLKAQERGQKLIENYIKNIGEISNKEYQIKWKYEKTAES